jgi:O-antigen ligase
MLASALLLLLLAFLTGGDSAHGNAGMMATQLLAIPLLIVAFVRSKARGRLPSARGAIAVAALIVLVVALQCLPIPAWLWSLPSGRDAILQDLHATGIDAIARRWTLSPAASERDLYFLVPGLALFFCMLAMGKGQWRWMLGLVVALGVANLVLAVVIVAAGKGSALNPYPEFAPTLGGVFANKNHQADMLAVCLMLASVFMLESWARFRSGERSIAPTVLSAILAVVFLAALPVMGSRAGVVVAMLMLVAALLTSGMPGIQAIRKSRLLQVGSLIVAAVLVVGLHAALAWMRFDSAVAGSRYTMSAETLRIGMQHAPLGAGVGTFKPAFEQGADDTLLTHNYINNAHNDFAQWWLETGVAGGLVVLLALAVLVRALLALLAQRPESGTRRCGMAALMGLGVMVLHSTVDYPLRTQALMAVFGVLAGIAIAASTSAPARRRRRRADDRASDDATQAAAPRRLTEGVRGPEA